MGSGIPKEKADTQDEFDLTAPIFDNENVPPVRSSVDNFPAFPNC
jgi:hypothetical protein